ncbi:MAG TPA: c-type cytochrome [Burkholderiaceae bacterium]|nr:c-type cytochrome [Burkholderiaceae bacterium]
MIICCAILGASLNAAYAQDKSSGATIAAKGSAGAAACVSCHGVNGEGNAAAGFPRLAGLNATYIVSQLEGLGGHA